MGNNQLVEVADSFSNTYFNWQFHKAVHYCTPSSQKWLSYMASQVNQTDVDILRSMPDGAVCEIGEISYAHNDSDATVEVMVSNYLKMDTIGTKGRVVERSRFLIPVMLRNKKWAVNLTSVLRPEKD